jgi:hypothetical protein
MQAKGFFSSLFDYSFSSFITARIIKVLYVLMTIAVALWTLLVILLAFRVSSAVGFLALLIGGPIFFVITMVYIRVGLELIMVFFRIHGDVAEINRRGGGGANGNPVVPIPVPAPVAPSPAPAGPVAATVSTAPAVISSSAPEPASEPPTPAGRFCDNCGAARSPGKRFCTACGEPLD